MLPVVTIILKFILQLPFPTDVTIFFLLKLHVIFSFLHTNVSLTMLRYNTCQKSWDTLHNFNLDETLFFVPLLPFNNVGFGKSTWGNGKTFRVQ